MITAMGSGILRFAQDDNSFIGIRGEEVAIRITNYLLKSIHLRIATSSPRPGTT